MSARELLEAVTVAAELTGTQLTDTAKAAMVEDLLAYPEQSVLAAVNRCRRELTGRLTLAAIIERIRSADGWPSANEAWATALRYFDESETVILNDEMREACATVRPIIEAGDEVGARMAFRDTYERAVSNAREAGRRPQWVPSIGDDKEKRALALTEAVSRGMLDPSQIAGLLPAPKAGLGEAIAGLLTGPGDDVDVAQRIAELREKLKGKPA